MSSPQVLLPTDFSRSTDPAEKHTKYIYTQQQQQIYTPQQILSSYINIIYRRTHETEINISVDDTHVININIDTNMNWNEYQTYIQQQQQKPIHEQKSSLGYTIDGNVINDTEITLSMVENEIICYYQEKLWKRESVEELIHQIIHLLDQTTHDPSKNLLSYSLITSYATSLIPNPMLPLDGNWPGSITSCFDSIAGAVPANIAIYYQHESITYHTLYQLSNQLSHALIASGLKKGDVVGLYGYRSPSVVWAILGILKTGCVYCMMDPKYPTDRIITCMSIANPKGWISIEAAGPVPTELDEYLISLNLLYRNVLPATNAIPQGYMSQYDSHVAPSISIQKHDIAVMTFTSGSTGIPKGVQGRHISLTHFYPWMSQRFGLSHADRFSMCSGIAHDPLQRDIFTPLYFGASVAIPNDMDIVEPGALAEWMEKQGITVSCLTPAMGQLLTSNTDRSSLRLNSLRMAFFVGDLLIKRDVYKLRRLAPNVHCINMYGSTETQRSVGYLEIESEAQLSVLKEVIPVGRGMKDVDLILLNAAGQQAGIGELSEIYVRSPHLAHGYMGLDDSTSTKFIINPFYQSNDILSQQEDRMYRTGDLGRYMINGDVECAGRADDQIKIRGFRIELGEINAHLSKHRYVKENVTVVKQDPSSGNKILVSYVIPFHNASQDPEVAGTDVHGVNASALSKLLRRHLTEHLPHYMVPTSIVILQSMPLTPNGKINHAALPSPSTTTETSTIDTSTCTSLEKILIPVWNEILGISLSSVNENFFDVGGHSLTATLCIVGMKHTLDAIYTPHIDLQLLYTYPTITTFAKALDDRIHARTTVSTFDLDSEPSSCMSNFNIDTNIIPYDITKPITNILLTGVTGFLGAYLLHDIIVANPMYHIYASVRAKDITQGMERIQKNLQAHQLWQEEFRARITPILSDLSLPQLGIDDTTWLQLSTTIDMIIHNGALVHWLYPYSKLKETNVNGTVAILRLASTHHIKPVHHVSTTSVFDGSAYQNTTIVTEDEILRSSKDLKGGYPQSKWVAEQVCFIAKEKGVPVSVYRPGYITGDSRNGLWNTDDFLCRFIKGCIQLKKSPFPDQGETSPPACDMSPVNYVSSLIIQLSQKPSSINHNFHIVNPSPIPYQRVFSSLSSFGYPLEHVSYAAWRETLLQQIEDESKSGKEENALFPVAGQFTTKWLSGLSNPIYDMTNVRLGTSTTCPDIEDVMATYVSYLIGAKFLPSPSLPSTSTSSVQLHAIDGITRLTRTGRS